MPDKPSIGAGKIILGTMRLLEGGRTAEEAADYFVAVHQLGVRTLHSSCEYESFPFLTEVLRLLARRDPGRTFRHLVKLAEPSFDDDDRFSAGRLSERINRYREMLEVDTVDIQWMWRRKLEDDAGRIADFRGCAEAIGEAVEAEKSAGSLGRLVCFPYSAAFASAALQWGWVDGLAVYRNLEEQDYESALQEAAAIGKTAIVIRPFLGGKLVGRADPSELLAAALDGPAVEAAVLSTNSLDHLAALLS